MLSLLKVRLLQFLLLVSMVIFLAPVAQAGATMDHHHHEEVISPFDKTSIEKPLHCALKQHHHFQSLFCPHQKKNMKSDNVEFRPDCGPQSGSASSANSGFAKELSKIAFSYGVAPSLFSSELHWLANAKLQNLPRAIDFPPQLT